MTKIATGTFLATDTQAWGMAIGKKSSNGEKKSLAGDYLLLWPYWYSVSESDVLKYVGKSELTWPEITDERKQATTEQIADDLASVLHTEFDMTTWEVYEVTLPMVHATLPKVGVLHNPGNGMPSEGDYVALIGSLYAVGHIGKLKLVGTAQAETTDPADFVKDFARLTGLIAVDINSLERPATPEQIEAMVHRMPKREQGRFLHECERLFGLPPASKTHD